MPYLYASPEDHFCLLRGIDEDGDEGGDEGGGPVAGGEGKGGERGAGGEAREPRRFWDGSRDRWISVVSARVDPDAVRAPATPALHAMRTRECAQDLTQRCGVQVTNQLGVLPRHEVQVPPGEVNEESEVNARCAPPAVLPRLL